MSDGGWPPVGGQFRQPDRAPFFRLTQAFGLRSLRKNGYVPNNDFKAGRLVGGHTIWEKNHQP